MKTRILLVDADERLLEKEREYFTQSPLYEVVGVARGGEEAVRLFKTLKPDAMVLDMLMPTLDGVGVLERIDKENCKIIAVSEAKAESMVNEAMDKGADYYLVKPFALSDLDRRISALKRTRQTNRPYRSFQGGVTEQRISEIFMTVGIPAHIKGYQFLREAIKMAIDSPEIINSITKKLYPEVATRFSTSASKVERAIRHAIEVAWNKGKIENINSLFGVKVYSSNEKPTNGEFIALVADKMLLENM